MTKEMPGAKELLNMTSEEFCNIVLLEIIINMIDDLDERSMTSEDQEQLKSFKDWMKKYISDLESKQDAEKRDLEHLVAKSCLYD